VFVDPDARGRIRFALSENGEVTDFEAQMKRKSGAVIDTLTTATVQFEEDGSGRRIQGVVRDGTRQKRYERELRSSLREKEALLDEIRQVYEQERRRVEFMGAVNDITLAVSSVLTLDELMSYLPSVLSETFGYYSVNIFLEEPYSGDWVLAAGANTPNVPVPIGDRVTPEQTSIVGWVGKTGDIVIANDVEKDPRYLKIKQTPGTKSELAVPIKTGDNILGVLDIQSTRMDAFDETDQFTAQSLANQLAVSIENAHLFEQTRDLAVLEERNRMAREIHDTLAQGFTGVIMQLEAGEQALEEGLISDTVEHLERAKSLS
jgi:GAF domain-containing protein